MTYKRKNPKKKDISENKEIFINNTFKDKQGKILQEMQRLISTFPIFSIGFIDKANRKKNIIK